MGARDRIAQEHAMRPTLVLVVVVLAGVAGLVKSTEDVVDLQDEAMEATSLLEVEEGAPEEGVSLGEAYSLGGGLARCQDSKRALATICRVYGQESVSCKAVSKAATAHDEEWGCMPDKMGESWGAAQSKAYQDKHKWIPPPTKVPVNAGCQDYNKDQAPKKICDLAKKMCGPDVKKKDYCTARLHYDCLASIGKVCDASTMIDPKMERQIKIILGQLPRPSEEE